MNILRWLIKNSRWVLNEVGATFAVTHDFTANTVISSSQVNTNFADVETAINDIDTYIASGSITNAMLAQITTASKVSGAALTGLANVPSGAGALPIANGGTEFDTNDICLSSGAKDETGWTEITSSYAGRHLRVGSTGLATGGSATHTHTGPSHTHTGTTDGPDTAHNVTTPSGSGTPGEAFPDGTTSHTHIFTSAAGGTGNTGAGNNTPLYVDMRLFQKS